MSILPGDKVIFLKDNGLLKKGKVYITYRHHNSNGGGNTEEEQRCVILLNGKPWQYANDPGVGEIWKKWEPKSNKPEWL